MSKELTFDDFREMARNPSLSGSEKIGFPDSYRKGFSKAILKDILTKLPLDKSENKVILDIGCGCDDLTFELIALCKTKNHKLILIDSEEMLKLIPDDKHLVKIPGKFPFHHELLAGYNNKIDHILCYSVLFYVFANDNIYTFLHEAVNLLKSGGYFLVADLPNIDKRDRFLDSEEGKKFQQNAGQVKGSTAHENRDQKMDDSILFSIMTRFRRFGCETYLLPQNDDLPMSNRREDILIVKR